MDNIVSIENLNKSYDDFKLNNINLNIKKGKILGIMGENGAGKTTTIKAILNLINIDSGNIKIFGLDNIKNERQIKENVSVVLDNSFLPGYYDLIDINKVMKDMQKNWNEKLFFDYCNKFKLPKNKMIKYFSKGMFIKMKIAVALSTKPKLLILDEPTSGLNPIARSDILDIFSEYINGTDNSILISSHITTDLEKIADSIILIDNGSILFDKTREELLNNYLLIKCNEEEFNKLSKDSYIRYKKDRFDYKVLVYNSFTSDYKYKNISKATLEDIMLLYTRGDK